MNAKSAIEAMAIQYFVKGAEVLEPKFDEIDLEMSNLWKELPIEVGEPIVEMLQRVVAAFKNEEGAELRTGDSDLMICYYIMARSKVYKG